MCQLKKGPEERFTPLAIKQEMSTGPSGPNSVHMQTRLEHTVPNSPKKIVLNVNHLVLHQCQCSTHERRATLTGLQTAVYYEPAVYRPVSYTHLRAHET